MTSLTSSLISPLSTVQLEIIKSLTTLAPFRHTIHVPCVKRTLCSCTRYPLHMYVSYSGLSDTYYTFVHYISQLVEPSSYEEARYDVKWVEVMDTEIKALKENHT